MNLSDFPWVHIFSLSSGVFNAIMAVMFIVIVWKYDHIIPLRRKFAMTVFSSSSIMIAPMYLLTTDFVPISYFLSRCALTFLIYDLTAPLLFPKRYEYQGPLNYGKIGTQRSGESPV
jgi:hypothetical protein